MSNLPEEHALQYESLRVEIMALVDQTRKVEVLTAGAVAAIYAWLGVKEHSHVHSIVWWIPFSLAFFAFFRSLTLFDRIELIAVYLRKIEVKYYMDPVLPGYERWLVSDEAKRDRSRIRPGSALVFWTFLLSITLVAPLAFRPKAESLPKNEGPKVSIISFFGR